MNELSKCASSFVFLGFRAKEMTFKTNEHCIGNEFNLDFDIETNFYYKELNDKNKWCSYAVSLFTVNNL